MWKSWKRKVSNFFFEEEWEEEPTQIKVEHQNPQIPKNEQDVNNHSVHTKVTYQYPTAQNAPFRFPVIPDSGQKLSGNVPKRNSKQRQKKKNRTKRFDKEKDALIYGYKRQQAVKELEDIPA